MTVRNLLLRAYPRSWREEYGEELAAILAPRRLTSALVADVAAGAARQRFARSKPWKMGALALVFWTCFGLILRDLQAPIGWWFVVPVMLAPLLVGIWTVLRQDLAVWTAGILSASAFVIGSLPDVVLHFLSGPAILPHGSGRWYDWGLYYKSALELSRWSYARAILVPTILVGALLGFLGGLLGRFLAGLREGLRDA